MNKVNVKYIASEGVVIPEYKTSGAAGADVCAHLDSDIVIERGKRAMIPTGLVSSVKSLKDMKFRCALVRDLLQKTVLPY